MHYSTAVNLIPKIIIVDYTFLKHFLDMKALNLRMAQKISGKNKYYFGCTSGNSALHVREV